MKNVLRLCAMLLLSLMLYSCEKEVEELSLTTADGIQAKKKQEEAQPPSLRCDVIDFENADAVSRDENGFVTSVLSQHGANVKVTGYARASNAPSSAWGTMNRANIFNTAGLPEDHWDYDLSTPNWNNTTPALGSVLIVQELVGPNNDVTQPNDNAHGGILVFDFSEVGPVTVNSMHVLDIEEHTEFNSRIDFYDASGQKINASPIAILPTGNNGVNQMTFSDMKHVIKMVVTLDGKWNPTTNAGSGAVDNIAFCLEEQEPCGPCEGKVSELRFNYNGPDNARLVAKVKNGSQKDQLLVIEDLDKGDTFTVSGAGNPDKRGGFSGTLGTELILELTVDGLTTTTQIHTSCSQPIYQSYANNTYTTISGSSKHGGPLCEFAPVPD